MKNTIKRGLLAVMLPLALMLGVSACEPLAVGLTSAKVGIKIYEAVKEAKAEHPDDFTERARFYASVYCEFRDDNNLVWADLRAVAIEKGAPEWAVNMVKRQIDKRCGTEAVG